MIGEGKTKSVLEGWGVDKCITYHWNQVEVICKARFNQPSGFSGSQILRILNGSSDLEEGYTCKTLDRRRSVAQGCAKRWISLMSAAESSTILEVSK